MTKLACPIILMVWALCAASGAQADDQVALHYVGRYKTQSGYHDHLMGVEPVAGHYALVSSNLDIAVVDLDALTVSGTQTYVYRLAGLDVYTTVTRPDGYVYANLRMGGFAVIYFDEQNLTLSLIRTVSEPGVFFEKLRIVGDRLYVAAHSHGIRIYDLSTPSNPILVAALEEGFDDAWAVAVQESTAYVADGAGGLKIVDVSDESNLHIIDGQDPASAPATAEDILIADDHVYVASGGAGVAVYELDSARNPVLYDTPICAKQLARVGEHLAVADIGGIELFHIDAPGSLTCVAGESGQRRSAEGDAVTLRLWHGVAGWGADRVLAADWDSMDLYELVDPSSDDQPDITVSTHRLRFAPAGGEQVIEVYNEGSGPLHLDSVYTTQPSFSVSPVSATLTRGDALELTISYDGTQPGSALVMIHSDDPDEDPLPIEVFGDTLYLDPGEPAIPFTLESWTYDHTSDEFIYGTFNLEDYANKVVFFHVFGLG